MDQKTFPVKFGNADFVDDFGFSGRGNACLDKTTLCYIGKKRWPAIKTISLFCALTGTLALIGFLYGGANYLAIGITAGVVIGLFLAMFVCLSRSTQPIPLAALSAVNRDGKTVRFLANLPESKAPKEGVIVLNSLDAAIEIMSLMLQETAAAAVSVRERVSPAWRITRIVLMLLYMIAGYSLVVGIALCVAHPALSHVRWANEISYKLLFLGLVASIFGFVFLIAFLLLARLTAQKIKSVSGRDADEKKPTDVILTVLIAAALSLFALPLGIPIFVSGIGAFIAVIGTLYAVVIYQNFRWGIFLIAALVPGAIAIPTMLPAFTNASILANQTRRNEGMKKIMHDLDGSYSVRNFQHAIDNTGVIAPIPDFQHGLVVLDESAKDPSPIDAFIPEELAAHDAADVKLIIIAGQLGPRRFASQYDAEEVVVPILIYSWPKKELLAEQEVDTRCIISDPQSRILPAAAKTLLRTLDTDAKSPPSPTQ